MGKNRRVWILLLIVIVVGAGGYAYYTRVVTAEETAVSAPPIQTALVRQGDLTISATGAGTVIAAAEVDLSFQTSGVLSELQVQVGDNVKAGAVLARIDDTNAQATLANAELQLAQTIMQTDGSATQTGVSYNDIAIEQARINLAQAQDNRDDLLNWAPDEDEIAKAEAALTSAQASYNAALGQSSANNNNIAVQQINRDQAQRSLDAAQAAYDTAYDPGREWETMYHEPTCQQGQGGAIPCTGPTYAEKIASEQDSAENALIRAQASLAIAQANYNSTVSTTNNSSVVSAEANVLNAELALAAAQEGPTEAEITAAETAVRQAELALQQAQLNQEADNLNLAQTQRTLETAQAALADTELVASMDGTVMSIAAAVGENVGTAPLITLANLEPPTLELFVDETDMSMVGLGFEVEVIFDALPDDVFTGRVVQVDPQLTNVSGVTAVRAVVQLDAESFAKPQTLPVGLNATVDVIGGRANQALLVPVEALRELSPGEFAVFVMENDEPVLRFVEVGIMDFSFAAITSGLEAGEVVSTGIVETQ